MKLTEQVVSNKCSTYLASLGVKKKARYYWDHAILSAKKTSIPAYRNIELDEMLPALTLLDLNKATNQPINASDETVYVPLIIKKSPRYGWGNESNHQEWDYQITYEYSFKNKVLASLTASDNTEVNAKARLLGLLIEKEVIEP